MMEILELWFFMLQISRGEILSCTFYLILFNFNRALKILSSTVSGSPRLTARLGQILKNMIIL